MPRDSVKIMEITELPSAEAEVLRSTSGLAACSTCGRGRAGSRSRARITGSRCRCGRPLAGAPWRERSIAARRAAITGALQASGDAVVDAAVMQLRAELAPREPARTDYSGSAAVLIDDGLTDRCNVPLRILTELARPILMGILETYGWPYENDCSCKEDCGNWAGGSCEP